MSSLTALVNQISPYDAVNNPNGSSLVSFVSDPVSNESLIKSYWVIYSLDGGDSSDAVLVEIRGIGNYWFYTRYPPFLGRKNLKFAAKVEEQVSSWWQSTGKNEYVSRSAVRVDNADLKYGVVDLIKIDSSVTPHRIVLVQKCFIKTGASTWDICDI